MNTGFWMCMMLVPFFGILAFIFYIGKEKATNLLAGFNALPEKERMLYDRAAMAKDQVKDFTILMMVMLAGAVGSWLLSGYVAIIAYIVFFVLIFKDFHLDSRKAYKKYLLK